MSRRRYNKQNWITFDLFIFIALAVLIAVTCKLVAVKVFPTVTIELKSDTVYAAPGEQEAETATITVTPTLRQEEQEAVVVTVIPTPIYERDELEKVRYEDPTLTVKRQICDVFKSDCDRAIEVARAESGFNPNAKNPGSTATGIFQIIRGTWNLYKCEGERTNSLDNIKCAKKIYDRNHGKFNTSGGWEASFHIHGQE